MFSVEQAPYGQFDQGRFFEILTETPIANTLVASREPPQGKTFSISRQIIVSFSGSSPFAKPFFHPELICK